MEYSAVSSLHGLQYIFESGKSLSISKAIWLVVVLAAAGLGIIWSNEGGSIIIVLIRLNNHNLNSKYKYEHIDKIVILFQVYQDWQSDPTVNYLKTTGLPLSDINFPSITICGQGSIYEVRQFLTLIDDHEFMI